MNNPTVKATVLGYLEKFAQRVRTPWYTPSPRMKHSRRPFSSSRHRGPGAQRMQVEGFRDKDMRDARFRELRAQKTPHLSRYSTYDGGKSLWCVVYQ